MFKKKQLSLALALGVSLSAGSFSGLVAAVPAPELSFYGDNSIVAVPSGTDTLPDQAIGAYDDVVNAQAALKEASGAAAIAAAEAALAEAQAAKSALTGPIAVAVYAELDARAEHTLAQQELQKMLGADATVAGSLLKAEADAIQAVNAVAVPGYTTSDTVYNDLLALRSAIDNATTAEENKNAVKALADFEAKLTPTNKSLIAAADTAVSNVTDTRSQLTALNDAEMARDALDQQALQNWANRALEAKAQYTALLTEKTETEEAKLELLAEAQAAYDAGLADAATKKATLDAANVELTAAYNAKVAIDADSTATAEQKTAAANALNQAETAAAAAKVAYDTANSKVVVGGTLEDALNNSTTGAKSVAEVATTARKTAQTTVENLSILAEVAEDPNNPAASIASAVANEGAITESIIGAVSANYGFTQTNAANIATNTSNIASNLARINQNSNSINQLNDDVDILRSGVASALALAGMPMTPGKGWGASVGTGYFDGESAIAAGLVYKSDRYNFKFGIGNSGGETSASAGVSFDLQ